MRHPERVTTDGGRTERMDFTEVLEILVVILIAIEIVELYFSMRIVRGHEKELEGHLQKLEQATVKLDNYITCVNQVDERIKALDKLLQTYESSKS